MADSVEPQRRTNSLISCHVNIHYVRVYRLVFECSRMDSRGREETERVNIDLTYITNELFALF